MLMQTSAIFYDAYRALSAKRLFWVALAISGLVVLVFGLLGIDENGVTILGFHVARTLPLMAGEFELTTATIPRPAFYKILFVGLGIQMWLSTAATALALISTAGIFPDLITSGSIDLVVARPIGRLRLFLTQYAAALLFVSLQIAVFSLASFFVIGLRGGVWEPGLFLAVPLVVLFFSYIYCFCVFLGITTRSTLAALLGTLLFWGFCYAVHLTEGLTHEKADTRTLVSQSSDGPVRKTPHQSPSTSAAPEDGPDDAGSSLMRRAIHGVSFGLIAILPKTSSTLALLEKTLAYTASLQAGTADQAARLEAQRELIDAMQTRSLGWVVGTSLLFECMVLALAAWIFCRRDFS